jgi:uncharacterized protein with FMN-binding domain
MKRALLIAGGTVGGLGAVLAITPPQFTSSQTLNVAGAGLSNPSGNSATTAAPASTPTNTATTTKPTTKAAVTTSSTPASTQSQGPVPAATQIQSATPTPTAKSVSGTFTGPVVDVSYGNVQVQITVSNGKITDAQALVAPTGKNDRYTSFSVPVLRKQTLAAQSDAIQGASGASYTSYGWYKSLQGALSKAGL